MSTEPNSPPHGDGSSPAATRDGYVSDVRYGLDLLRRHGWRIALLFAAVLLPLWGFGELAEEVREGEVFVFDAPILHWAHALHSAGRDQFFLLLSKLGYAWGVIPLDIVLVLVLTWRHFRREALFASIAFVGSAVLNLAAKQFFSRERPALWTSIAPETTFSFPSGHAMGSMTLAAVLVLLAWRTRWRWLMVVIAGVFVVLVGMSRVYLGVHYPSDILAGWTAALAWVLGVYAVVFRGARRPWQETGAGGRQRGPIRPPGRERRRAVPRSGRQGCR